ncbi:PiggyBac transposable element-derived protein 2 [Araneus ventricosus]|uniref:PiggyBac transposable element-derived protein 2 n=1 Tax=Araneus ventricosus TaxID=182803 RepID=A0A4Y2V1V6_ARAVE|nr:PiggyBac transposable element-derived protein 2 [Araneus ventricosus]
MEDTWKKRNLFISENDKKFKGNLEYPDKIINLETPFQFVKYFLTDELFQKILDESMLYAFQKDPNSVFQITKTDLQKYLGICLLTSVTQNSNVRDFWNDVVGMELVKNTMSLNNFEKFRSNLHFNNNEKEIRRGEPGHDKLFKIRPVINSLLETFSSVRFEESLSIDEQMCATKVKHHLRQYMKNKPHKWGYKLFVLCSTSGFAYNFEIYSGQENSPESRLPTEPDLGASSNVVVKLTRDIPKNMNHKLYFDNYYSCVPLLVYLHKQGILSLGTARRNRIPNCKLPTEKELKKFPRGSSDEFVTNVDGVDVSSVIWKDNRCVVFLSTFTAKLPEKKVKRFERSTKTHKEVDCPEVVTVYNKHMGGVDLLDSHLGRHRIRMKAKKWYFRLFYHLIDLAIINAWILYKEVSLQKDPKAKVLNQKLFRTEVAEIFCKMGKSGALKRGRPSNEVQRQLETKKKCPRVVVPPKDLRQDAVDHWPNWNGKRNRCKMPGCNGFTYVSCTKCLVFLCFNKDKNCYQNFHI